MKKINLYESVMNETTGIRLNGNESYKSIEDSILKEVLEIIEENKFNRYPDTDSYKLRKAYAKVIGLEMDNIIAGNGSDEMIQLIIGATIKKRKKVLTVLPDFSMYDFYTSGNEGEIIKYNTEEDGSFVLSNFINFGKKVMPSLIIISNPNNPTGHALSVDEVSKILENFPKTKVVIDEAYYEFYGQTMIPYIDKYSNLIITRTLSKAWGLAALRIGFLISNKDLIEHLNKFKVPYNLSQLAQDIASVVLKYPDKTLSNVEEIVYERERLYKNLKDIEAVNPLKITFYPSKANYIFARSDNKEIIKRIMEEKSIILRYFNDDTFRITVGAPWENDLVVNVISMALGYEEGNDERAMGAS